MKINHPSRGAAGFSLIELMIAMVAGLIVVGAVLAFTLSSLRSNTDYVQSTRLTQDLRNAIDYVSAELRRAGYDENAMSFYSQAAGVSTPATSPFTALLVSNSAPSTDACLIYAYDRASPSAPGVVDLSAGEIRGVRRLARTVNGQQVGVIEVAESTAGVTPGCGDASPNYDTYPATCVGGWCALTDPRVIDITGFVADDSRSIYEPLVSKGTPLLIRDVSIRIEGHLLGQPDVTRAVTTRIKVRADCLRTQASCNTTPVGT